MIMTGIALAILAGAMTWSANSTRGTHRSIQYNRTIAAAEAATEKVLSQIRRDFVQGGEKLVTDNLANYRQMVPTTADSAFWGQWHFDDGNGQTGRTYVQGTNAAKYVVLNSTYAGLRGFVSTYSVVSHAREAAAIQNVVAGVLQEIQLARIPVFQFAMYSSADMEIGCAEPFTISGLVHANKNLYIVPRSVLTFKSDVTAVGDILFQRHPEDSSSPPSGSVIYEGRKDSHVGAMSLPIGTNNTPEAIREIILPPPTGEDPSSPLGRLRYYNQVDMILVASNGGITATSGRFNNFATVVPTNELAAFVRTTNSFRDAREEKTVRPIDLNVGALADWSRTNTSLRVALGSKDVTSLYVLDRRTLSGTELNAVRVSNGQDLPASGFTLATARPLYVWGHYNQTNSAHLGTTNTTATRPASFASDAISFLSTNWLDANSTMSLSSRIAKPTTVNAAILTGVVESKNGYFSGGMENFPRFLESWGTSTHMTYNGSMVKMFPSSYATNRWGKSDVYSAPSRKYSFDRNFEDATKLPPLTPSLEKVIRGQWATVAPNKNTVAVNP
jgi:hypothetical protein